MQTLRPFVFSLLAALAAIAPVHSAGATTTITFKTGSYIIPMDITYQDSGMLQAFGLVDALLRANVPVHWAINASKQPTTVTIAGVKYTAFDADFTASATDFQDVKTVITKYPYRGGPFIIDLADVAVASPIVTKYQASLNFATGKTSSVKVHVATADFTAPIAKTMSAAPRIAIIQDNYQAVAYNYLDAAGIPDSKGTFGWNDGSPDSLSSGQVAGVSAVNHADGKLFRASGAPDFCDVATMHYDRALDPNYPEVAAELVSYVQFPVHMNAECLAVGTLEGRPPVGGRDRLLTSAGFADPPPGQPNGTMQFSNSSLPFAQMDGNFLNVSGAIPAFGLPAGSVYYDNDVVMIRPTGVNVGVQDIWMTGYAFGSCPILTGCQGDVPRGKVSFLAGHGYNTITPISRNSDTNGTRLWLNAMYETGCVSGEGQPTMTISASAPASTSVAQVTFTLTYKNAGPGAALDASITDILPAGTTFVSASNGGVNNKGTVTWTLGDLASGATGSVTVNVTLNAFGTFVNNGTIKHTVGLNTKSLTSNNTSTVYSGAQPVLGLTASAPATTASPNVTFTMTYTNTGSGNAQSVVVSDPLPPGVTFTSASNGGVFANGVVTWTIGNVAAGATASVTVTGTLPAFGTYANTGTATYSDGKSTFPVTSNTTLTTYGGLSPLIVLSASAPPITAKANVIFSLAYNNAGTSTAKTTVISDKLPANATFVSASNGGVLANGVVTWSLGDVAGGASGTLTVNVTLTAYGVFLDQFTAAYLDGNVNLAASSNVTTTVYGPAQPSIALVASAPATTAVPQVTFTINYANPGNASATAFVLSDKLPQGATFVSATNGGVNNAGTVTWALGTLTTGASGSVSVTLSLPAPGTFTNTPTATYTDASAKQQSTTGNTTTTIYSPPLTLTASAPATTNVPQVTFTLDYNNTGGVAATAVTISDVLPPNATFVSASNGGVNVNGTVTWTLPNIAAGATGTLTVTLILPTPGTYNNLALSKYTASGLAQSGTSNTTTTIYSGPTVTIATAGPGTTPVAQVTYIVTYANSGVGTALGMVITNTVPVGASFISASNGGVFANGVVTWALGDLAGGSNGALSVTVSLLAPGMYTDTSKAAFTVGNTPQTITSNTVSTNWPSPGLVISAAAPATVYAPTVTFTLVYTNTSQATVQSLVLVDTLPPNSTVVSVSNNGLSLNNGTVLWTLGDVPAGGTGTLTIVAKLPGPGTYTNQATGTFPVGMVNSNVNSNKTTTVFLPPQVTLTATAPAATSVPTVTFTLGYTNGGTLPATGLIISDALPNGATFVSATGGGVLANNIVTWNAGTVVPGGSGSVTVTVKLAAPGVYANSGTGAYSMAATPQSIVSNVTMTSYITPALSISIAGPATTSTPTITDTITYTNTGKDPADGVVITDPLPVGAVLVSAPMGCLFANNIVTCKLANSVFPGTSGNLPITYTLPAAGTYTNQATASYTQTAVPVTVTSNTLSQTLLAPVLSLVASAPATTVVPTVTFSLAYNNAGPGTAVGLKLTDTLPMGATFVSASNGGTVAAGVVTWNVGDLPPSTSGTVTVTVTLAAPGNYANSGVGTYSVGLAQQTIKSNVTNTNYPVAGLTLVASAPPLTYNSQVTFTINYANTGMATAQALSIADALPAGATFVAASNGGSFANGSVTWSVGDVAGGASGSVFVTVNLGAPGSYKNSGTGSFTAGGPQVATSNTTTTVYSLPTVAITAAAPATTTIPQVTFTLSYANSGLQTATGLIISDKLPPGVTVLSATGGGTVANGIVSWSVGDVLAGGTGTVAVSVTLPTPGIYTNQANGSFTSNLMPVQVSSNTTSTNYTGPVLTLTSDGPATTAVPTVTYTINYTNGGNVTDTGLVLTDTIPLGAAFVSASNGGTFANGKVTWSIGDLPGGATGSVTVTVTLPKNGVYTNAASGAYSLLGVPTNVQSNITTTNYPAPGVLLTAGAPKLTHVPTVTFTFDYSNTGVNKAAAFSVTDPLPAGATFVSASNGGTYKNGVVTWTLGDLAPNASGSLSVTLTLPGFGTYTNQGTGQFGMGNGTQQLLSNVTSTDYLAAGLTLALSGPTETTSSTATYTITFLNTGETDTASALTLLDKLPPGETFVSASNGGTLAGGTVTWNVGDVPPGAGGSVTFTVTLVAPGTFTDQAGGAFSINALPAQVDSNVVTTVYPAAGVTLVATGPDTTSSDTITYDLAYKNAGEAIAMGLTITDALPAGATLVAASQGGTVKSGVASWTLGDLAPGAAGSVQLTVKLPAPGTFIDQGSATFTAGMMQSVPSNTVTTIYAAPTMTVAAIAPATTNTPLVAFSLVYTNTTGQPLSNVVLYDDLLPGESFVSATNSGVNTNGLVSWTLGNVAAGASATVTVNVKLGGAGTYANQGTATFTAGMTNGIAQSNVTSTVYPAAGVSILTLGPAEITDGTVTYTIQVTNTGMTPATGFVLTDALPPGAMFVSASNGGTNNGSNVVWPLGDLPPGTTETVTVTVKLPLPGTYESTPTGTYNNNVNVTGNTVTTVYAAPGVAVVASAPATTMSSTLTFTLNYTNSGVAAAKAVLLTDAIPAGATFVSASGGGKAQSGVVTWSLGDLAPGASAAVSYTVTLPAPGSYANRAIASYTSGVNPVEALSNITSTLYVVPTVAITTSGPATTISPTVTWLVSFVNNSTTLPATRFVLTDKLPPGATFVSASNGGTLAGGVVTWSLGDLPPGAGGTVSITVSLPSAGSYTDSANGSYTAGGLPLEAQSNATTTLYAPNAVTLIASGPSVTIDPRVTYTIAWANTTNVTAQMVTLTDVLPAGATFVAASGGGALNGNTVSWSLGDVAPGAMGSVILTVTLPSFGDYRDQATATYTAGALATASSNVVLTTYKAPALSIVAIAPSTTATPPAAFTLVYTNNGPDPITGLVLQDKLLPGVSYVASTMGGVLTADVVSWNVGNLAPGASGSVTVNVTLAAPGFYVNQGTANYTAAATAQQATSNATTTQFLTSGVQVTITGPGETPTPTVTYTIRVTNTGMTPASNVIVSDPLPPGAVFVGASNGGVFKNGVVTWNVGDLPVGTSVSFTLTVTYPTPDTYVDQPSVTSTVGGMPQTTPGNTITTVYAPQGLSVTASAPDTVYAPTITFTLDYLNSGMAAAQGVVLRDPLPPGATLMSASNGGAVSNGVVVWNLGDLAAAGKGQVTMTVSLLPAAFGTYLNQAIATYQNGASPAEAASNTTSTLYATPGMTLVADAPATTAVPAVTFTFTYTNASPGAASNVVLSDVLPPGVTFISADKPGTFMNGVVTWSLGTLMPGATATLGAQVILGAPGTYSNDGAISYSQSGYSTVQPSNTTSTLYNVPLVDGGVDGGLPCSMTCNGNTPICDSMTGMCRGCRTDADCPDQMNSPACQPDGTCKQCSATNQVLCVDPSPICDVPHGMCARCTIDVDGGVSTVCNNNPDGPVCVADGLVDTFCGCNRDSDCGTEFSGMICDLLVHKCAPGCSPAPTRNHCPMQPAMLYCTSMDQTGMVTGICTDHCLMDSDCNPVPMKPYCIGAGDGMGNCSQCRADPDCALQPENRTVCAPSNHSCVQCIPNVNTKNCVAGGAGAVCLDDGNCGCLTDGDCGAMDSGRVCDTNVHHCAPGCRGKSGNHCPSNHKCSSLDETIGTCGDGNGDGGVNLHPGYAGGGFGCSVAQPDSSSTPTGFILLGFGLGALLLRRRRKLR